MKIYQSRLFEKTVKKLTKAEKNLLDNEVRTIATNPKTAPLLRLTPLTGV